jgi:membrane-bound lytic murein transglycosylase D
MTLARIGVALVISGVLWLANAAVASDTFPKPAGLRPQIDFWKRIFAEVSENQVAIHDDVHLDRVYAIVDLPPLPESGLGEGEIRRARRAKVEREVAEIRDALERLHRLGPEHASLGARDREIAKLLAADSGARKYREASARLRTQTGLRERFRRGLEISRGYLPHLEKIFRDHGVPTELTRLPLIESTFNVKAYSKVGAAGIWQFMPASAKIYGLRIDEAVDERRDPLIAAGGAARYLRKDYEVLGSWPLAVTAYNHGRGGMARAMRELGTDDIVTIVRRYKGRTFGFASRNFYAEFVAALEVDADRDSLFPGLRDEPVLRFDEARLDAYVPFRTLVRACDCSSEELRSLNLSLLSEVTDGKLHVPRGTHLRLPAGKGKAFRAEYAKLGSNERFASQRAYWIQHRVASGQSVGAIARRYGTSVSAIQSANGLKNAHRIRVGQVLKIPTGKGRSSSGIAVASRSANRASSVSHRVSQGQTIGAIASRYGTSVPAIQSANGLASAHRIRVGQVLKIPTGEGRSGSATAVASRSANRSSYVSHRVSRGQTVASIAKRYGTTVRAIQASNDIDIHRIRPGQVLKIPRS